MNVPANPTKANNLPRLPVNQVWNNVKSVPKPSSPVPDYVATADVVSAATAADDATINLFSFVIFILKSSVCFCNDIYEIYF